MLNKLNISENKKKLIVYVFLAAVTFTVYWQVNQYDFINLDDNIVVTENSHIQSGITLDGVRWAFSTTYTPYTNFWYPLMWLSIMFDYQLYGTNAGGYHITNLVLHILSTLLLFWLFNRMTGAIWKSAFVAALFALHPLHVESVAWITKRKDVLSAFFWMLTLFLYVYYTEKPAVRRYLLVLFSFVCALLSKPMVVTLPVVMILLDYWPLVRFQSQKSNFISWQLREKIPFFVLLAFFSIITFFVRGNPYSEHFPLSSRLANASISFMTYLEKTFWPHNLAFYYPFSNQLPIWQVLGASSLILVISVFVIVMLKRLPYIFVGWLWYAITILPVIGIIQVSSRAMSYNYTYLPSIGIAIMLAWGIPFLFPNENIRKRILFPAGIAAIVIMAILTWRQCGYWKNSTTLFSHDLQVTNDNYVAHSNLAFSLIEEGNLNEAIYHCNEALRIRPDYVQSYNNRGFAYDELGQYQLAIEDYNKALHLKPDSAEAYNNRGNAYLLQGNKKLGCQDAQKACELENCKLLETVKRKGYCR